MKHKVRFTLVVPADNSAVGYACRQILGHGDARARIECEAMLEPQEIERLAGFAADGDRCEFLKQIRNGPNPTTIYAIEVEPRFIGYRQDGSQVIASVADLAKVVFEDEPALVAELESELSSRDDAGFVNGGGDCGY